MSLSETVTKKHIYFCYAEENEFDSEVANKVKDNFNKRRFRIYYPRSNEDINTKIATGIENALVVFAFASPALQKSKNASKLLNYADQTKTPIVDIRHCDGFQPKGWLGTILASAEDCSTDYNDILKILTSLKINIDDLILERNEKNEVHSIEKYLFYGGTEMGNVIASYQQYGKKFPMKIQFLGLDQNKIFGQGHDDIGDFTLAGEYKVELGRGTVDINKQYIDKHSVKYQGTIVFQGTDCKIQGKWKIKNLSDAFSIQLILSQNYTTAFEKQPILTQISRKQGNKVMISYCPNQYDLAQKLMKSLIEKGIPTICPSIDTHEMIKIAIAEAKVVIPIISQAYEESTSAKYVLSYVDQIGIPIIPVKAQVPYSASGWLGVICAGSVYTRITDTDNFEKKLDELIQQLRPYMNASSNDEQQQQTDALADDTHVQGYYIQWGKQFDMKFDMFIMNNGYIAGQGEDEIDGFVISGEYTQLPNQQDYQFKFLKHYIEHPGVEYIGTTTHDEHHIFLDGTWHLNNLSDKFHLEIYQNKSSEFQDSHVMLSYQWNNQQLVKRVAEILRRKNIPIWFDIAGDMKGNINAAMANGVERAAAVVSFNTAAYSQSVNCQKELIYAWELKKSILPVLLEDQNKFEDTWLGKTIASLNKIHMQDDKKFESNVNILVEQIYTLLRNNTNQPKNQSDVITRFEGGAVQGKYYQYNQPFDMVFDFFSLKEGRVSGQGHDTIGHFIIFGKYDNQGNVSFTKQYIEKHAVQYNGHINIDKNGYWKIEGQWKLDNQTDQFYIENINN